MVIERYPNLERLMRNLRQYWIAMVLMLTGMAPAGRRPAAVAVAIQLFHFDPDTLEVPVGTSVTWTNGDDIEHTVTGGDGEHADGRFAGSLAAKGTAFSFTFERPGEYSYFCDRHHFMRGIVRVTQP
jgi:plastocyanin